MRPFLLWLSIVPVAIANGALRTFVLNPLLGERVGHVLSSILLSLLIVFIACAGLRSPSLSDAWRTGVLWLCLTVLFEFVAGHWVFRQPWERLLADYDISSGRVWILVLLATLTSPAIAFRLR